MLTGLFYIWLVCRYGWYCNLLRQWGYKMLDRTRKRVGHEREREVWGGRGEMGKYRPTWIWHVKKLLTWLPVSGNVCAHVSFVMHRLLDRLSILADICQYISDYWNVGKNPYRCNTSTILIVNLHAEKEWMEKFMWEEKTNKWNNFIMKAHHRNCHTLVVYYHAHWSILYLASLPIWVAL